MSEALDPGSRSARIALSALTVQAARLPPGAAEEPVDYYDSEAFGEGAPRVVARSAVRAHAQAVEAGDVLLSRIINAPRRSWVVSARQDRPQLASSDWLVLRPGGFDSAFLRHLLVSNDFHLRLARALAAGRKPRLAPARDVGTIEIPAPSIPVQQRMATVLEAADALRAKRNAVAAKLEALPDAVFSELCTDRSYPDWPRAKLGELLIGASASEALGEASSERCSWLLVRAANIARSSLDVTGCETRVTDLPAVGSRIIAHGDILVARAAAGFGTRAAVAYPGDARWLAHEEVVKLRVDPTKLLPECARALIGNDAGRAWRAPLRQRSRRRSGIEARDLAQLEVPLPPMAVQKKLAALCAALRDLNDKLQHSARRLDALLGALRDAAFRGELRVD